MNKLTNRDLTFSLIAFLVIFADQFTKSVVRNSFELRESFPVVKGFFHFTYTLNTGSGFSLIKNQNSALIWTTIIILGVILYNYDKIVKHRLTAVSFALIVGGALGNLIDRFTLGGVVDFFDFIIWPVFNIADSATSVGVVILLVYLFRK